MQRSQLARKYKGVKLTSTATKCSEQRGTPLSTSGSFARDGDKVGFESFLLPAALFAWSPPPRFLVASGWLGIVDHCRVNALGGECGQKYRNRSSIGNTRV